jgi:hypothetical protein
LWRAFQDWVSWTICLGWLWTTFLLLSSWDYRHESPMPASSSLLVL